MPNPAEENVQRLINRKMGAVAWFNAQTWGQRVQCPSCKAWTEKKVGEPAKCSNVECAYVHDAPQPSAKKGKGDAA